MDLDGSGHSPLDTKTFFNPGPDPSKQISYLFFIIKTSVSDPDPEHDPDSGFFWIRNPYLDPGA